MAERRVLRERARVMLTFDPETTKAVRECAAREAKTVHSFVEDTIVRVLRTEQTASAQQKR